jgi:serine/threonine protein kinase/Flp pilus assembly protein TadD
MNTRVEDMRVRPAVEDQDSLAVGVDFAARRSAKREILEDFRARREAGQRIQPEDLLPRWPENPHADADVASLLFEDYQQRRNAGEDASIADYERRFPEHRDSLAGLVRQHAVWRSLKGTHGSSTTTLALPAVGDELFGFRLCRELGRGAFARVFLAEQRDLAGRPVVLKVSAADGNEPQTLAQLQHTHIVPIYSVHEDARAGLRAVCMPYFGGASLSAVLRALYVEDDVPTRGQQLVRALAAVRPPWSAWGSPGNGGLAGAPRGPLDRLQASSYVKAVAWLGARLAEALEHAHQRGVLHRDIKPSNILLGADGQPMLLDFNLAQSVTGDPAQATLGGTVAYMAPEHLLAIARGDPVLAQQVGRPADIYSLGMVLYEMLTGQSPFDQSASYHPLPALIESMAEERRVRVPSLRPNASRSRGRPDAPWSLESVVRKCLAPDKAQRYQQAEHLAEDLRRFLEDRPLRYAPELSRTERVRKWLRRHPRLASSGTVAAAAAVLLLGVGVALLGVQGHLTQARDQLGTIQAQDLKRQYIAGTERALCLVNTTSELRDHLHEGLAVCERTLGLYDILECDDWQDHPSWQRLSAPDRARLREDTRELLMMLAAARVRAGSGLETALREALSLLDRAENIADLPPSPALWLDRADYLGRLGDQAGASKARETAQRIPPASARDHYLLATTHARARRYAEAIAELTESLRLNDRHYWSWFQRGLCYLELGKLQPAASDFGVCVGLWPEFAWGHFNLGYVLYRGGARNEAIDHFTAALDCDPYLVDAAFNRGLAFKELGHYDQALADFDQAAALGRTDAGLHAERGLVLEKLNRPSEADAAFEQALTSVDSLAPEARAGVRLAYGFAVVERLPDQARAAFEAVGIDKSATPQARAQALYGQGLLAAPTRPREAIATLTEAVEADPNLVEARRFRGILWARCGDFEAAGSDINWCLGRDPTAGGHVYAAACVTALAAKKFAPPRKEQLAGAAIELLKRAFALGYGRDEAANDPDLAALRGHPEFRRLLKQP